MTIRELIDKLTMAGGAIGYGALVQKYVPNCCYGDYEEDVDFTIESNNTDQDGVISYVVL